MKYISSSYIEIGRTGLFEFLIAVYPILSGYAYGWIHLNDIVLLLICLMAYYKTGNLTQYKHFKILSVVFFLHELIVWLFFTDMPSYMLNNTLSILIYILSISIIVPAIDFKRYIHAIVIVSIIVSLGLIYHFILIRTGHSVSPIPFPGLPSPSITSRLFEIGDRPVSFFWEPAGYANYMLIPMAYFLMKKKYIIVFIITSLLFLSTSSTGVLLSLMLILFSAITNSKNGFRSIFFSICLLSALVYFLLHSEFFAASVDKIENTDIETTSRLFNGPELFRSLKPIHFLLGIPYANVTDYFFQGASMNTSLMVKNDTVFVPTFYLMIAKYGVFIFVIYLYLYLKPVFLNKELISFVIILFISFFFASNAFSSYFVFQMIFIYSYLLNNQNKYE